MKAVSPHRLAELEQVIERGMRTFVEVGTALKEIRDSRLYRESHATFEDYCRERWSFARTYAHYLIESAEAVQSLRVHHGEHSPLPSTERQARELARIKEPEARAEVWREVTETHGPQEITAKVVRETVARRARTPETYPFMNRPGWKPHELLEAEGELEKLPEYDQQNVATLLDQDAIPPDTSIGILKNMVAMSPADREEVYRLAGSESEHDRQIALTKSAALPSPPDPALVLLWQFKPLVRRAAKLCATDEFRKRYETLLDQVLLLEKDHSNHIGGRNDRRS